MTSDPCVCLATNRNRIHIAKARCVLIAHYEVGLITAYGIAANQQVVIYGGRQGFGQEYPALQVVDVIVHHRHQVQYACHNAGVLVTQLDTNTFRASKNILSIQVVKRAACTTKFFTTRNGTRLRGKGIDNIALFTEARRCSGLIMHVGAIQATIDAREFIVHVADFEVAPLRVIIIVADAHEELAHRRREFLDRAVVTKSRVVVIRVDTTEQRVRRFFHHVAENIFQRAFSRVCTRRQFPVVAEFTVNKERQAPVQAGIDVLA